MISTYLGSILDVEADALVNPANSFLMNGAGLAGVIERAATGEAGISSTGSSARVERYKADKKRTGLIPTGDARFTSAGALEKRGFKAIIHTVGPIYKDGTLFENQLLYRAYCNCFKLAVEHGWSLALPAVSAGIFGMPIILVAQQAVKAAREFEGEWTFALMDQLHIEAFRKVLREQ